MSKVEKKKWKTRQLVIDILAFLLLIAADQFTKWLAIDNLREQPAIVLLEGIFELHYLENKGAAFGMLQNGKVFFVFAAIVMLTIIVFVLAKTPAEKKYRPWHIFLILIAAGGIGNMVDRLRLDYVVDFFYFRLIDFPIFNVADIYVTMGTALLVIFVLFVWKDDDLKFISLSLQKGKQYQIK